MIEVHRDWAPIGVDHFYSLLQTGYYDGNRFFRVTHSLRAVRHQWRSEDERLVVHRQPAGRSGEAEQRQGHVDLSRTWAPTSRTTQLFFNLKDNKDLDKQGFAPIGKVITGMDIVESLYSAYGDMPPRGQGPDPSKIEVQGNSYLEAEFPAAGLHQKGDDSVIYW